MSELPDGWIVANLDDVFAVFQDGRTLHQGWSPQCERAPSGSENEWGVLKTTAIQPASFLPEHNKRLPEHLAPRPQIEVFPGDLLITCAGPRARCGIACLVRGTRRRLMMSGKMYRFRMPEQHVSPRYMEFYLQTAQARLAIDVMKTGGSDSGLNLTQDRFRRLPVPLAPRAEQERIVVAIEEEFSRLDAGVGALERARQNLKRMRATVLERSTTGDLVDPEPSSWRTVAVGDVAEVSGGITKNPRRAPRANPIPFLRVANVPRDGLDLADIHYIEVFDGELERFRLRDGDLLVVEGNGSPDQIGRSALWTGIIDPCVHQNHLIRIRPSDEVDPRYLNLFWNAPTSMRTIQAQASSTSGLHTLSTEKVRAISVALPSISAQRQIVDEASRRLSSIGDVEAVVDDQLRLTRSLRSSILTAAFSGKLVPQDPDDEDAAVLLRRLNAERASSNGQKPAQTRKLRTRVPA